jgi:protein arginine kinase
MAVFRAKERTILMKEESKYLSIEFKDNPWLNNASSIELGSTLTLYRNIEKLLFPGKLPTDKQQQVIAVLSKEIMASPLLSHPKLIKAEEISIVAKEFLVEHFLTAHSLQRTHSGEAFIVDDTGQFLVMFNIRNHLGLEVIDCKGELELAWDRLVKLEMEVGKKINYAYSSQFGFLTADPEECGTSLLACTYLHLPALIHSGIFHDILDKKHDEGIHITGLQGSPHEILGDIVAVHNNYTLGVTEESILSTLRTFTTKLVVEEKRARSAMKQEGRSEVKDKVSRAYAILLHSYQIEVIEAMQAISLIKMGLDLEWLTGTTHADLNGLFFIIRRAHLLSHFGDQITQEEIPHRRAEFIHKALKNTELHI